MNLSILFSPKPFQSTHPRGVRHLDPVDCLGRAYISIHAPARGAIYGCFCKFAQQVISIHAPARGATLTLDDVFERYVISIHAPARGATWIWLSGNTYPYREISIHAPARGATRLIQGHEGRWGRFQSTHPRGVRPQTYLSHKFLVIHFNPRTREGCDSCSFRNLFR